MGSVRIASANLEYGVSFEVSMSLKIEVVVF
jgi:hypothetical protein